MPVFYALSWNLPECNLPEYQEYMNTQNFYSIWIYIKQTKLNGYSLYSKYCFTFLLVSVLKPQIQGPREPQNT